MDYLVLKDMHFYAYHGVMEQERTVGNRYTVNAKIGIDLEKAAQSDSLEDSIDYGELYHCIEQEMQKPSRLIEHLGCRICQKLREDFPQILSLELRLTKHHPPICGNMETAEVILSR